METPVFDGPSPYVLDQGGGQKYSVTNFDKRTHGIQPLRVALANSLNIPAVKVEMSVGVPAVVDFFRNMGMRPRGPDGSPDAPDTAYGPSLTLGGYAITMLEEATALSVYADMGLYHRPEAVLKVTDPKNQVRYQADFNRGSRQALEVGVAFIIASILSDDANRQLIFGTGTPLHLPDRHAAAKTGTTEDFKDALTIGFTPDLATVVWVGDILGIEHHMTGNQTDGVFVAAPAWHKFMETALKGMPDTWYNMPTDVKPGRGNSYFLVDTPKVDRLPNDNPSPSPASTSNGIPPDPGTGPQPIGPKCPPILPIPLPGCR
jgi:membrane peptidoglycan carboxypeptidase